MADAFELNVVGATNLVESGINKVQTAQEVAEGPVEKGEDVLSLDLSDEELLELRENYENKYGKYEGKMIPIWKENIASYSGKHNWNRDNEVGSANMQFQAEETFLAAAMAQNPDPTVYSTDTKEGNKLADDVRTMLEYHAQVLKLRQKLKVMVRKWSIYHLAAIKMGWNAKVDDVDFDTRKTKNFIFDPDGFVDEYGNFTSWLGERCYLSADELIKLYPEHKAYITLTTNGKLGTTVMYTEWHTDDFMFVTYVDKVLEKHRNPLFNYPNEDEEFSALNHFAHPLKPYIFLSVFSLQEQPHDITGLIEQNIPNQKKITRRSDQIDVNVSKSNNSDLYSMDNFNQETAKQAAQALRNPNYGEVLVPPGRPIGEAIARLPAPSFPSAAFDDLEKSEQHLLQSWGVQGLISQEQKSDVTAKGMMINQSRDTSRIGGGITDIVEQVVAVQIYNWLVQLYKVFYDEVHSASVMGKGNSTEYIELSKARLKLPLVVGVSPNSMKPQDELTQLNQAMSLYEAGVIGPKTLLEAVKFPNADEAAADGVLWKLDPAHYFQLNFPEEFTKVQQIMAQQPANPAEAQQAQGQAQQNEQQAQAAQQQQQITGAQGQQKLTHAEQSHQQEMAHKEAMAQAKLEKMRTTPEQ
jgi:hypothetical protein